MRKKMTAAKRLKSGVIRCMDIFLALLLLPFAVAVFILLLPPQLVCFGGIFYTSLRTGQAGKIFRYVKLKTMRGDPSAPGGGRAHLETWRIPPWGGFLRMTHLDEIPELFFILAGRESFVGPRPLLPEHAALVDSPERRGLKPGWTGLSQIFLKTRGILPSRIQRRLDQKLGGNLSPLMYIKIICATFFAKREKRSISPGPTVRAYRSAVQKNHR